jgi:FixJ family two-component response regulator
MRTAKAIAVPHVPDHVAVVEDDAPVRRALVRVLAAAGFRVSSYGSAEEFLATQSEPSPACLLIDIRLPQMDGLALEAHLRRAGHTTPVVLITADHDLARRAILQQRRSPCLTKPIDDHTLIAAITRAMPSASRD